MIPVEAPYILRPMIRIAITPAAFEAIAATLPRQRWIREQASAQRRLVYLARPCRRRQAQGSARPRRILQRRHSAAGGGERVADGLRASLASWRCSRSSNSSVAARTIASALCTTSELWSKNA